MLKIQSMFVVLTIGLIGCWQGDSLAQDKAIRKNVATTNNSAISVVYTQQDEDEDDQQQQRRSRGRRSRASSENRKNHQSILDSLTDLTSGIAKATVKCNIDDNTVCRGTIVDPSGLVIVKNSTVPTDKEIRCELVDGRKISAKKIASDEEYDIALLQLEGLGDAPATLTQLNWCTGDSCDAGSFVATVADKDSPVALGIVTVKERQFRVRSAGGNGNKAFLGVQSQGQDGSLVLTRVLPNTAASRAGLKDGDILASVNDEDVKTQQELVRVLGRFKPEETIELVVKRADKELKLKAKLGKNTNQNSGIDRWGGGPFTDQDQKRFGYPTVLAHDSVIRPEFCGTPLVNTNGEVVGINISRALRVATYAVPAEVVLKFIKENKKTKSSK